MERNGPVKWGILGTANIATSSFLPGLRAAGQGVAVAVAGRDRARVEAYARGNGIERALGSYAELVADDRIDAVYNPLPNALHATWTTAALRAGKTVLCEKPLCISAEETVRVLQVARETGQLLWENFVFPFRTQIMRLQEVISEGTIGEVREIQSTFHFMLHNRINVRLVPELGGGALYDLGCYPIRLSRLVFDADPDAGMAAARWAHEGVDEEMQGMLHFSQERHLLFSCGMAREQNTFTRVLGTRGEIRLPRPFHPLEGDAMEIRTPGKMVTEYVTDRDPPFTAIIRHIHAVLHGEEEPRHLAIDDAMGNARAIDMLYEYARAPGAV